MKRIYKNLLSLVLGLTISTNVSAQAINEGFNDITTLAASGWVQTNLSTPVGTVPNWVQGLSGGVFEPRTGAGFIQGNFNLVAGANTISCWLISPSRTFSNGDIVTFWSRTVDAPAYADRMQVRLSVNGTSSNVGATNTSVGDFTTLLLDINPTLTPTGYPNVWTQYSVTVAGLPMPLTGRLAFRYFVTNGGPTGSNSDNIGIDDFVYTPVGSPTAPDVTVTSTPHPYTIVPLPQVTAMQLEATVNNVGTAAATDAMLTANVYQAPNFTTPIQTFSSAATNIANGANSLLNAGTYTPSATGDYMVQYISSCTNNTVSTLDTSSYMFSVSGNEYARDNGVVAGSYGIGAGPTGYIVSTFAITTTTYLDSVLIALSKPGTDVVTGDGVGDSTKVVVFSSVAGLPNAIIVTSPKYVFTPADTSVLVLSTHTISAIGGGSLMLAPGTYHVGVAEHNTNIGLANSDNVFNSNTVFASWPGQAWTAVEVFGATFAKTPVIRPFLNSCAPTASSQTLSLCAGQSVTVGTNTYTSTGTYTDVLTALNGCDSTVTTNLTVASAIVGSQTLSLCAGQSVTVGTNTYTSTGTYTDVLTALNGCDSTVTTNLTVASAIVGSQTLSLCAGQSVTVGLILIQVQVLI
ncbi:MAG: choice-of-anchor J domain-containing protein [Bacteroidetes bacterium]|nr:choice-of-anchor J domain-containing protein [Bacteroidota bacterium]